MTEATRLLQAIDQGDPQAARQLFPLVYDELRKLAAQKMAHEKPGQTLDATGLVHEAYLRLVGRGEGGAPRDLSFDNRPHFFAAAAEAMRRILIDRARQRKSLKRGGAQQRQLLEDAPAPDADERLLALDEALQRLAEEDAIAARVVEMHHFTGLAHDVVAEALNCSVYQARTKWTYARAWLKAALGEF